MRSSDLLEAALFYAEKNGWPVLPLHSIHGAVFLPKPGQLGECTCGNLKCDRKGEHPRRRRGPRALQNASRDPHGVRQWWSDWPQSRDPRQIRQWWSDWPETNIGVVTGQESGIFVLEVDDKREGIGTRCQMALEGYHGPLPDTLVSLTDNGKHFFFRHAGGRIKSGEATPGPGLAIHSDGGYIVAPPSMQAIGNRYRWENADTAIADAPDWLLQLLDQDQPGRMS